MAMPLSRGVSRAILMIALPILVLSFLSGCSTKNWTARDWHDKGFSQAEEGKYWDAIRAYTRSLEVDPAYTLAYENRGYAHAQLGNYRQALDDLEKVLSLNDPRVPRRDTYRELGVVYFRMGRLEDAVAAWKKGLGKAKDDAGLLNNLAVAYLNLNQIDKAADTAAAAYAVDPSLSEVMNTLGEVAMAKKEFRKAADLFLQAIDRSPDNAPRYWNAALAFEKLRQYNEAVAYARQYIARVPDPGSRQKAYELIGRIEDARAK